MSTTGHCRSCRRSRCDLVIAMAVGTVVRRRQLQARFGPEYDRTLDEKPNRAAAESDLRAREKRHAELDIKSLSPQDRDRYLKEWTRVQAAFVEDPSDAGQFSRRAGHSNDAGARLSDWRI